MKIEINFYLYIYDTHKSIHAKIDLSYYQKMYLVIKRYIDRVKSIFISINVSVYRKI